MIIPENTAIANGVARSARRLSELLKNEASILDYGAGKLRNTFFLKELGHAVSVLETTKQIKRIQASHPHLPIPTYSIDEELQHTFDAVLCSFVLNVIPIPESRIDILQKTHRILRTNGLLVIEVRKRNGIMKNKHIEPFLDGFIVGKNTAKTFQKPYEKQEFIHLISSHGFKVNEIESTSDGWMIVAQKIEEKRLL